MESKAHVIMCNDSPEAVVLGFESDAKAELERLKDEYYQKSCRWTMTRDVYEQRCVWRIMLVNYSILF